jgi:outer membrane lipoprotein-sorting protein
MNKTIKIMAVVLTVFASAVFSAGAASAQTVSEKILKANDAVRNIECKFHQSRTIKASGKTVKSEGTLYYNPDGRLAMRYSTPASELLIINANRFHMNRGGKAMTFDTSKNETMGKLAGTLLGCIRGDVKNLAEKNGASLSEETGADSYVITLKTDQVTPKGYSRIILTYRKSDCTLTRMQMEEFSGISTVYEMDDIKRNVSFPEDVFRIPSR